MFSKRVRAYLCLFSAMAVLISSMGILLAKTIFSDHILAELDHTAPQVQLGDINGNVFNLRAHRGENVVLVFASPRCPVSRDYMDRIHRLAEARRNGEPVRVVQILCGRDALDSQLLNDLHSAASTKNPIPILLDLNCDIALAYGARCTPTCCVIDTEGKLRYSGAFDDNRNEALVTRPYVEDALRRLTEGMPMAISSTQVFGYPIGRPK